MNKKKNQILQQKLGIYIVLSCSDGLFFAGLGAQSAKFILTEGFDSRNLEDSDIPFRAFAKVSNIVVAG